MGRWEELMGLLLLRHSHTLRQLIDISGWVGLVCCQAAAGASLPPDPRRGL